MLGHDHHQGLLQMKSKMMVKDLPEFEDQIPGCKACQYGKLNRKPFSKATGRASGKLQLIHTDVSGPQRTPSLKGNDAWLVEEFKQEMMKVFEMTGLGLMTFFLGMEIKQAEHEVFICQKKYAKEILNKFKLEECKEVSTPMNQKEKLCKEDGADKVDDGYFRSLIGCLMYLTATRPAILNAVSILSRFMHCASELHLKAAKRVIRYVKGTSDFGVKFTRSKEFMLVGFSDSDWGGSIDDMRSTSGYCSTLGSGVFSWSSKKQETVAQSTAEAEFVAATAAVNQALWLRKILMDLNLEQKESTEIFVDNQAAIAISHNPVFHGKTKHFNIKLLFVREVQKEESVTLAYYKSED